MQVLELSFLILLLWGITHFIQSAFIKIFL